MQCDVINHLIAGSQLCFARPDALSGSLLDSMLWARPTAFFAVPRIWEKFEDRLKQARAQTPKWLLPVSDWAKGLAFQKVIAQQTGGPAPWMYSIANAMILRQIKKAIGLDRCFMFAYGAAPMKSSSTEYFASLDIPLFNCYGLSETSGTSTIHNMFNFSLKHAGMPLMGTQIAIAEPDDNGEGEVIIAGRHIMMGYKDNEEATRECIDDNGFFRTGDRGIVDSNGFIKITGRIKELIITAGGENIAPVPLEDTFKSFLPCCSNVMLVGEGRRFISALITFKVVLDMGRGGEPTDSLEVETQQYFREQLSLDFKTSMELIENKQVQQHVQKCIDAANAKAVSRAAHIKKFVLLAGDFS